jgi:O-acetyl-ADP-ribose deacetylase (regulator of RNase III)
MTRSSDTAHAVLAIQKVRVIVGPWRVEALARQRTVEAIVSSDDTLFSMSGGVSKAILHAAGSIVQDEAKRLLPVHVGDVVVTSAGALPIQYLLHAITLDPERGIHATDQTVRSLGRGIFAQCEKLDVVRIAVPAIAAGTAAFPAERSARILLECLADHASNPTALREVVFCLPDKRAESAFLAELTSFRASVSTLESAAGSIGTSKHSRWWKWRTRRAVHQATEADPIRDILERLQDTPTTIHSSDPDGGVQGSDRTNPPPLISNPAFSNLAKYARPVVSSRYVLLEEIGRGGMGVVYLCWDVVMRHVVAIKALRPGDEISQERIDRLKKEATIQMHLAHESIVRLFHFEPWEKSVGPYMIMEYVPWTTGDRWVAEAGSEGLPARAVLQVGMKLCEALACAHDAGVLHGDIKPNNVFVDPSGERAKIGDFGIATVLGPKKHDAFVTRLIGTPRYMAPEQKTRGAKVGPWTDVYLLAGTLWELITCEPPGIPRKDHADEPAAASALAVLNRGLAPVPEDRPQDAKAFGSILANAIGRGDNY